MTDFILTTLTGIIVSIVTAYTTVRLSIKQFYSQRWWEKKAEAYSQIIEQLSYLQYCFGEWFSEGTGEKELSDDVKKRLLEDYHQAKASITKAAAIGAYIVSEDTAAALKNLLHTLKQKDPESDWVGDIDRYYGSVKDCIRQIREYAKQDLQKR